MRADAYRGRRGATRALEGIRPVRGWPVSCSSSAAAMSNLDALRSINIEQLVTPLDRLLLSSGHVGRAPTRRSFDLSREAALAVAASMRRRATHDAAEKTYV